MGEGIGKEDSNMKALRGRLWHLQGPLILELHTLFKPTYHVSSLAKFWHVSRGILNTNFIHHFKRTVPPISYWRRGRKNADNE